MFRHNSGTAFRTVGAQGAVDSVGTLTSFHHSASVPAAALNTKAPMSMTDEEFRAAFIPNTPPVEPSLLPMQVVSPVVFLLLSCRPVGPIHFVLGILPIPLLLSVVGWV